MTRYAYWDYTLARKHFDVTIEGVDNEAVVLIRDSAYDVTAILEAMVALKASDGSKDSGITYIENNSSAAIFDDGTDVLTLAVASNGETTLQRTAGTMTFDVTLRMCWI